MASTAVPDKLTGLPTREALDELDRLFRARPDGDVWSVIIADIDSFKMINDVYGHLTGDRVLQQIAYLLVRNTRHSDEAVRFGGDEFVIVLPGTRELLAANFAERFIDDLQKEVFTGGLKVNVSLGLAESLPEDRALSAVIEKADKALYDSKARSRGKLAFYSGPADRDRPISFEHFVNRQSELRVVRNALDSVSEGGSRAILLTGEPGVGKTRLAGELRNYCAFRGGLFAETKYDEVGGSGPLGMLVEPMAALSGGLSGEECRSIPAMTGPVIDSVAGLFPLIPFEVSTDRGVPEWITARLVNSQIASILRAISSLKPLVLFVDDVQWAYMQDLDLLGYVARTSDRARILFLLTMRSPVESFQQAWNWCGVLRRFIPFERIDLEPLEEEHATNLIMLALRDPRIPGQVVDRLISHSGGNPYYLRELLKSMTDSGAFGPDGAGVMEYRLEKDIPLPGSVSHLVRSRLDSLDRTSREVLRMGSLLEGSFSLEALAYLMELPALRAAQALEDPIRMGLVIEEPGSRGGPVYRFNHDCVRSCLLEELSSGVRTALYSRLGAFFEDRYRRGSTELLQKTAYCYSEGLDPYKAAEFCLLSARDAEVRQRTYDQAEWLGKYILSANSVPGITKGAFFEAWLELGRLHTLHALHEEAEAAFAKAADLASTRVQSGLVEYHRGLLSYNRAEYDKAVDALERASGSGIAIHMVLHSSVRLAFIRHLRGDTAGALAMLESIGTRIGEVADAVERRRLEAQHASILGFCTAQVQGTARGLQLVRSAAGIFESIGDRPGQARTLLNLASILSSTGAWEERLGILTEAGAVLTELGDIHSLMVAYVNIGQIYEAVNQLDLAEDYFRRTLGLVEATGTPRFLVWAENHLGTVASRRGDHSAALKHLARASATAAELGYSRMLVVARINSACSLAMLDRFDEARKILDEVESKHNPESLGKGIHAGFLTARGMLSYMDTTGDRQKTLEEALSQLRQARALTEEDDSLNILEISYYEALCLRDLGRTDRAASTAVESCMLMDRILGGVANHMMRDSLRRTGYMEGLQRIRTELAQKG